MKKEKAAAAEAMKKERAAAAEREAALLLKLEHLNEPGSRAS